MEITLGRFNFLPIPEDNQVLERFKRHLKYGGILEIVGLMALFPRIPRDNQVIERFISTRTPIILAISE